jgi:hypothetical protein
MAREKFLARRATTTVEIRHRYPTSSDEHSFCISYSRLPSGRIGEVWVNTVDGAEKRVNDDVHDTCIAVSLALQYGAPLDQIGRSVLRSERGRPHSFVGAIVDALKKEPMDES